MEDQTKILVVDDDENIRMYVELALRDHYDVTTATGGKEALAILENQSFDLILCDLNMPEVDGSMVLAFVQKTHPKTPMIIMSATEQEDRSEELRKLGVFRYIYKPITIEGLQDQVKDALETKARENNN